MKYDFETIADAINFGFGASYDENRTMMAGAQLHLKTAPCVIEALTGLAASGLYGYTPSDGADYLGAIVNWMRDVRRWRVEPDWIVPSYGTLQGICACMRAFTAPGDGVIVQQPVYLLYAQAIQSCDRALVDNTLIYRDGRYEMDFDDLEAKMRDPRNRMMVLCNPHNPIMDVWGEESLRRVAELAERHHVLVVADEIFAEHALIPEGVTPYASIPGAAGNCVICTSIGKAFNFTGTSHANIIIPDPELRARYIRQRDSDHYGSLSPFMRVAVLAAYTEAGRDWIRELLSFTAGNEAYFRAFFAERFPQVRVCRHGAGTLLWCDFRALGDEEEVAALFERAGVVPDLGSKYGAPGRGFLRLQIGMPRRELSGALERLDRAARG